MESPKFSLKERIARASSDYPKYLVDAFLLMRKRVEKLSDPMEVVQGVYDFLDLHGEYVSSFTVCSKGCSHCCKIDVGVSGVEADYISFKTGIPKSGSTYQTKVGGFRSPCPFLSSDGSCGIYEFRPFPCRVFATIDDPGYCERMEKHVILGSSDNGYGSKMLLHCAFILNDANNGINGGSRDIRDHFGKKNY